MLWVSWGGEILSCIIYSFVNSIIFHRFLIPNNPYSSLTWYLRFSPSKETSPYATWVSVRSGALRGGDWLPCSRHLLLWLACRLPRSLWLQIRCGEGVIDIVLPLHLRFRGAFWYCHQWLFCGLAQGLGYIAQSEYEWANVQTHTSGLLRGLRLPQLDFPRPIWMDGSVSPWCLFW